MKFTTLSRRTAAAGAASALVAGALVGATTTAAQATPVTNTYTCSQALLGEFPVFLTSDAPGIEGIPGASAGFTVPPQLLSVTNTFTIPDAVYDGLVNANIENLTVPDFAGSLGSSEIPVEGVAVTVSGMVDNGNNTWSTDSTDADGDPVEGGGLNASFETPAAGDYPVLSPEAFTIVADLNGSPVPVACTIADGTTPGAYDDSIVITKNDSKTNATATNSPVKKGEVAKVKVKVVDPTNTETPGGKVVLKKGTKTLDSGNLNAKGVVTLKFNAKTVGKNKLKALYKGDGYTNKSSDNVVVKVTR